MKSYDELEARLTDLEIKYAHQEVTLEEFNAIIIQQRQEIDRLNQMLKGVRQQISTLQETLGKEENEPPPPHY